MSFPRIEYNNIRIDFNKYFNDYFVNPKETRTMNESTSGHIETIDFFERNTVQAVVERLKGGIVNQLKQFWNYAKDGSSFKLWWDRTLGLYCDFEGKSIKSTDGDTATFSRTGAAYYEDPDENIDEDVYLLEAADGLPRMPAGKYGRGLLIESGETNILTHSEEFDNVAWTKTNLTVNADTTETLDPFGGNDADKFTANDDGASIRQSPAVAIDTDDGCFSIYLKALEEGTTVKLQIYDNSPAQLNELEITLTTKWARYDVEYDSAGANANNWRVRLEMSTNGDIIYADCAQLEVGTDKLEPTGYIKTEAAVASRNNESCYFAVTAGVNFPQQIGSISFWLHPNYHDDDVQTRYFIYCVNSLGQEVLSFRQKTNGNYQFQIEDTQGNDMFAVSLTESFITVGDWNHIVLTWSGTTTRIYVNGVNRASGGYTGKVPKIPHHLYIGSSSAASGFMNSIIDELIVHLEVLSDYEILQMANSSNALGFQRNYFSALKLEDSQFSPLIHRGGNVYDLELNLIEDLNS